MKSRIVIASLLMCLPLSTQAEVTAANLFLDSYGSQCSQVVTSDVGESLQNLQRMSAIVEELKADNDCRGSNQIASTFLNYSTIYQSFQSQNSDVNNRYVLEQKISRFTYLISDPTLDEASKVLLRQELVTAQSNLINTDGQLRNFETFSGKESRAAKIFLESVNNYVTDLQRNPQCLQKNGAKIANLVSAALLTTAAFATGGTALALAAGGVIIQSSTIYLKNRKSNVSLGEIETTEAPLALRCMSQVLTDQYCKNEETKKLFEERKSANNEGPANKEKLEGLNLLAYKLTGLSKWIDEVYSGSEINSLGDLINRSQPSEQAHLLRKITNQVQAFAGTQKTNLENIKNPLDRTNAIANSIMEIAEKMRARENNQVENPIFTSRSYDLLPYRLYDSNPARFPTVPLCDKNNKCNNFGEFVATEKLTLTIENFNRALENAFIIINDTKNQVNLDLAKKTSLDAYTVLVNANRDLKGEVNAYQGLAKIRQNAERISETLKRIGCAKSPADCETPLHPYYPQITNVKKTKELVESVMGLVRESYVSGRIEESNLPKDCRSSTVSDSEGKSSLFDDDVEKKSFQIIACISKILKIQERGNAFLFTKVRDMVSYDLEARLKNGELGEAITYVANTTRNDLVQSILNSYKVNEEGLSIDDVLLGLEAAQNNTTQMMEIFYDFFEKDFKRSLKSEKLSPLEKKDLCFRVIPFLSEENQDLLRLSYEMCKGVSSQAYADGPKISFVDHVQAGSGAFKKYRLKTPEASRLCFYRNFARKNRLIDEQNRSRDILDNLNSIRRKNKI